MDWEAIRSREFDKILANYSASLSASRLECQTNNEPFCQAVTDTPCANFADEPVAAYPKAKSVLTTLDRDTWDQSVET